MEKFIFGYAVTVTIGLLVMAILKFILWILKWDEDDEDPVPCAELEEVDEGLEGYRS